MRHLPKRFKVALAQRRSHATSVARRSASVEPLRFTTGSSNPQMKQMRLHQQGSRSQRGQEPVHPEATEFRAVFCWIGSSLLSNGLARALRRNKAVGRGRCGTAESATARLIPIQGMLSWCGRRRRARRGCLRRRRRLRPGDILLGGGENRM